MVFQALEGLLDRASTDPTAPPPLHFIQRAHDGLVVDVVSKSLPADEALTLCGEPLRARISGAQCVRC